MTRVSAAQRRAALARRLLSGQESRQSGNLKDYAEAASRLLLLTRTVGLSQALTYATTLAQPESRTLVDHVALQLHEAGSLGGLTQPSVDDLVRAAEAADLVAYVRLTSMVLAVLEQQLEAARAALGRIAEPSPAHRGDQG